MAEPVDNSILDNANTSHANIGEGNSNSTTATKVPLDDLAVMIDSAVRRIQRSSTAVAVSSTVDLAPGLKKMWDFNSEVLRHLDAGLLEMDQSQPDEDIVRTALQEAKIKVTRRLKHIKIANKHGWEAVNRYEGNVELGDDAEDEKRIARAVNEVTKARRGGFKRRYPSSQPFRFGWAGERFGNPAQQNFAPSGFVGPSSYGPVFPQGGFPGQNGPFLAPTPVYPPGIQDYRTRFKAPGSPLSSVTDVSPLMGTMPGIAPTSLELHKSRINAMTYIKSRANLTGQCTESELSSYWNLVLAGKSSRTIEQYLAEFNQFVAWCEKTGRNPLPSTSFSVVFYLTYLCTFKHRVSLSVPSSAIAWVHKISNHENPCKADILSHIKLAGKTVNVRPVCRKFALESNHIKQLIDKLGYSNNIKQARTLVFCVLAFCGFLRSREVIDLTIGDICFKPSHVILNIRRSKTSVVPVGVYIAATNTRYCPVLLLKKYVHIMQCLGCTASSPLLPRLTWLKKHMEFSPIPDKSIAYSTLLSLVKDACEDIGLDRQSVGLHSFRRGGATASAKNGINDRLFQKHGRWKCAAVKNLYVVESDDEKLIVSKNLGL